ncbi:MAG TPA: hypothetical protein PLL30_14200 [Candidatus Krumholzibacteria bacterium]|nr:hypothetical protein [Candidatus Krumholzibacteria bacterium]HPD72918.1 hypothetical protein [Candidatus Krumholzibacteria bacterium]HRY41717.1 hypothetical protein [Candidatus Krumholzibacteria bacterium]
MPGAAREAFLRTEIKAARSRTFYLVLDPAAATLQLRLQHVDLLSLPVKARFGRPRWAGGDAPIWPAIACTLATHVEEPERPLLKPGQPEGAGGEGGETGGGPAAGAADSSSPAITVEAIQAARERFMEGLPAKYWLEFEPDLDILVLGETATTGLGGWWRGFRWSLGEAWQGMLDGLARRQPRTRLILEMSPADARRLYLVLEPKMALLIEPPAPAEG